MRSTRPGQKGARSARDRRAKRATSVELVDGRTICLDSALSVDQRVAAIASEQRGRVARRQLLAAGLSRHAIDRRIACGTLQPVHAGVYAVGHHADQDLAAETAALLSAGPRAMLSHHSAATLWGMRPGRADPIHITKPDGHHHRTAEGVEIHRSQILRRADVTIHEGLPVTSPARTLLDVAGTTLTDRDIERLLDEAIWVKKLVTRREINAILRRAGRHPGRATLARVAGYHKRNSKTDSQAEEKMLALIRKAGLPEPEQYQYVLGHRLDFYWRELGIAVEVDTYGTHGAKARFKKDLPRDLELEAKAGVRVHRITDDQIDFEPLIVVTQLGQLIALAAHARRAA